MKGYSYLTLLVVIVALAGAQASPVNEEESEDYLWPIPQIDGSVRWMTRAQAMAEAELANENSVVSPKKLDKVRFYLYTQSNPTVAFEIDKDDPDTLTQSPFDSSNPTRFFVHGWNGFYLGAQPEKIRTALLLNGQNNQFNYIVVDWSVYAEDPIYVTAQGSCSKTGKIVAEFIDWLSTAGNLSFDNLALYGHSLGAHVVGFAGKNVKLGQVDTIVGLDPAMPLFVYNSPSTRLAETDARYVESIQTNGGMNGFYQPIGKAAFYPNGGKSQPGCGLDISGSCAHERVVDYLAEALSLNVNNRFYVVGCSQFSDVKSKSCKVPANGIRMGDPNNADIADGVYYLTTNSQSLYGKGP